jgi:glycosidase
MASPVSINEIDLSPRPGKAYFDDPREWREEFIYFLLVDRFHDGAARTSVSQPGRSRGRPTADDFHGGTLKGITDNLDYIAGLGCTAVWLSPVFENNAGAYHGYNTSNYLAIDPHFGTKEDLVDLVEAAHARNPPMRVILDVVINHSGDNWSYPGGLDYRYAGDQRFPFGAWRRPDRPVPVELRNEEFYHRRGAISGGGWDSYPENQHGDIVSLKDFASDDDAAGSELINILIKAHCYWIREADIDGFRVDAVKHMGELASSRFCSNVREYAYSLGKRTFFLFGEVASSHDEVLDRYIGQNTSRREDGKTVFFGLDALLDFPLAYELQWVIKGLKEPQALFDRLEAQHKRALNRGELGRYRVAFADNHDSFWQGAGRIANGAADEQVIAAIGYVLCALGTPCIYYGTEQGFVGRGGDNEMREAMFDASPTDLLNRDCTIYKEIAKIAAVVRSEPALRFGRMYFRQISGDGQHFGFPFGSAYTLAFSRMLYGSEVLVAYNVSDKKRQDCVVVDASLHGPGATMACLHGGAGVRPVERAGDGTAFVRLPLEPRQFAILR